MFPSSTVEGESQKNKCLRQRKIQFTRKIVYLKIKRFPKNRAIYNSQQGGHKTIVVRSTPTTMVELQQSIYRTESNRQSTTDDGSRKGRLYCLSVPDDSPEWVRLRAFVRPLLLDLSEPQKTSFRPVRHLIVSRARIVQLDSGLLIGYRCLRPETLWGFLFSANLAESSALTSRLYAVTAINRKLIVL